jgi:hypothetical protein
MIERLNRRLDSAARTSIRVRGHRLSAFRLCGTVGFVLGVAAGAGLAAAHGRSPWIVLGLGGVAATTYLALAAVAAGPDHDDQLVYYHHQAAVLAATTAALILAGAPVLAYLDTVSVGLGLFLVFGRIGCLMVGCCHGRPARVGISYGVEHVREGFPAHHIGLRLLPVQAFESVWTLLAVGVATVASWHGPGAGLAAYVVTYAAGRFVLEYFRGDGARPYLLAASEAQWTSFALVAAVVATETGGLIPRDHLHVAALALMTIALAGTFALAWSRRDRDRGLLTPRHLDEVARTIAHLAAVAAIDARALPSAGPVPSAVHMATSSQGLTISASTLARADGAVHQFGLSRAAGLTPRTATEIAGVVCRLIGDEPPEAVPTRGGDVYHLTVVHRRPRRRAG